MNRNIFTILIICLIHQFSIAQDISIVGSIWIDTDENNQYDGESGINFVKVYLINVDSSEIIDSAFTQNEEYIFPSSSSLSIPAGTYYLEIATEEFETGGKLQGFSPCVGSNDANDGVDNDDNGMDMIPVQTSNFSLDSGLVEYVDICFSVPCNEPNALASTSCDEIDQLNIICDISILGTFCNILPTEESGGTQPNPLCPDGGSPGNISWFAFVAYDGDYSIVISPSACMESTTGMKGIQVGLYTDCTFSETVICLPNCSEEPIALSSDILEGGQTYYIFIDGCGGSVCSYSIDIEGTPIPPDLSVDELCILDEGTIVCIDSTYTPVADITFLVDDLGTNIEYFWEITTLSGVPYAGETSPITDENTLDLTFDNEGTYLVCISGISNGCQTFISSGELCRIVTVDNSVGLKEIEKSAIKISPNPSSDFITIDGDIEFLDAKYSIYSIDGELLTSANLNPAQKIDVMDLPVGMYLVRVVDAKGVVTFLERFFKSE